MLITSFWASFIEIYTILRILRVRATLPSLVQICSKYTLVQIGLRNFWFSLLWQGFLPVLSNFSFSGDWKVVNGHHKYLKSTSHGLETLYAHSSGRFEIIEKVLGHVRHLWRNDDVISFGFLRNFRNLLTRYVP